MRRTVLSACTTDEPWPWNLMNVDYLSENGETTIKPPLSHTSGEFTRVLAFAKDNTLAKVKE